MLVLLASRTRKPTLDTQLEVTELADVMQFGRVLFQELGGPAFLFRATWQGTKNMEGDWRLHVHDAEAPSGCLH